MDYTYIPLNINYTTICHIKERKAADYHEGWQTYSPGPRPDTTDAPERMGGSLADLRDAVLCRDPIHQGPGVRLRPGRAEPRPLQAYRRSGHVALWEVGGHARSG